MPTWSEALVADMYDLQGYAVLRNVPVGSGRGANGGRGGGRKGADIIAFRAVPKPEIVHAEVGVYWEAPRAFARHVRSKFEPDRVRVIRRLVKSMIGRNLSFSYSRLFYCPVSKRNRGMVEGAKRLQGEVRVIFIEEMIQQARDAWYGWGDRLAASNVVKQGTYSNPPNSTPFVQLLAALRTAGGRR